MKFQRTDLIARVKDAIEAEEKAIAARNAKAADDWARKRQEYLDRTAAGWTRFADIIRRRVRQDQPITLADIPTQLSKGSGWKGQIDTWDTPEPTEEQPRTRELFQVLALLEATTDDEITTSALERLGVKTAGLFATR